MNPNKQNVLQSFWNDGELPTLDTVIVIDDKSILKVALALTVVVLIAFVLFKVVGK